MMGIIVKTHNMGMFDKYPTRTLGRNERDKRNVRRERGIRLARFHAFAGRPAHTYHRLQLPGDEHHTDPGCQSFARNVDSCHKLSFVCKVFVCPLCVRPVRSIFVPVKIITCRASEGVRRAVRGSPGHSMPPGPWRWERPPGPKCSS